LLGFSQVTWVVELQFWSFIYGSHQAHVYWLKLYLHYTFTNWLWVVDKFIIFLQSHLIFQEFTLWKQRWFTFGINRPIFRIVFPNRRKLCILQWLDSLIFWKKSNLGPCSNFGFSCLRLFSSFKLMEYRFQIINFDNSSIYYLQLEIILSQSRFLRIKTLLIREDYMIVVLLFSWFGEHTLSLIHIWRCRRAI